MSFVDQIKKPPKTLTDAEQAALLKTTGQRADGFRDHVVFSMALGTALREHEITSLNVEDVSENGTSVRQRFPLRIFKRSNNDADSQEALIPDQLRYKLEKFLRWKKQRGEPIDAEAPLFISRLGLRLTGRQLRRTFTHWQKEAGFERHFTFHSLRHTACTNLYRRTKDIRLVQKVARHKSITSTMIYTTVTDEEVLQAMKRQPC